jgi:hypothetical protein
MATRGLGTKLAIAMLCLVIRLMVIKAPPPREGGDGRSIKSAGRRSQNLGLGNKPDGPGTGRTGTEDDGYVTRLGGPPPVSLFLVRYYCQSLSQLPAALQLLFLPSSSSSIHVGSSLVPVP